MIPWSITPWYFLWAGMIQGDGSLERQGDEVRGRFSRKPRRRGEGTVLSEDEGGSLLGGGENRPPC